MCVFVCLCKHLHTYACTSVCVYKCLGSYATACQWTVEDMLWESVLFPCLVDPRDLPQVLRHKPLFTELAI